MSVTLLHCMSAVAWLVIDPEDGPMDPLEALHERVTWSPVLKDDRLVSALPETFSVKVGASVGGGSSAEDGMSVERTVSPAVSLRTVICCAVASVETTSAVIFWSPIFLAGCWAVVEGF